MVKRTLAGRLRLLQLGSKTLLSFLAHALELITPGLASALHLSRVLLFETLGRLTAVIRPLLRIAPNLQKATIKLGDVFFEQLGPIWDLSHALILADAPCTCHLFDQKDCPMADTDTTYTAEAIEELAQQLACTSGLHLFDMKTDRADLLARLLAPLLIEQARNLGVLDEDGTPMPDTDTGGTITVTVNPEFSKSFEDMLRSVIREEIARYHSTLSKDLGKVIGFGYKLSPYQPDQLALEEDLAYQINDRIDARP